MADSDSTSTSSALHNKNQGGWWNGIPGQEHVVKLNSSNYDNLIAHKPAFVMFFAQWCGYSRNARKAFAATAAQLAKEGNPIMIAAVDCDECKAISSRYPDITGYPSFLYIAKGSPTRLFNHTRTKEAFVTWLSEVGRRQAGELGESSGK